MLKKKISPKLMFLKDKRWWWQNSTTKMAATIIFSRPNEASEELLRLSRELCVNKQKTERSSARSIKEEMRVWGKKEKNMKRGSENSREKPIPLFKLKRSCSKGGFQTRKKGRNCVHYEAPDRYLDGDIHEVVWIIERHFGKRKKRLGVCYVPFLL